MYVCIGGKCIKSGKEIMKTKMKRVFTAEVGDEGCDRRHNGDHLGRR